MNVSKVSVLRIFTSVVVLAMALFLSGCQSAVGSNGSSGASSQKAGGGSSQRAGGQQVADERESTGLDRPTPPRKSSDPRPARSARRRDLLHDGRIPTERHAMDHEARLGRLRLGRLTPIDEPLGEGARSADPRSSL